MEFDVNMFEQESTSMDKSTGVDIPLVKREVVETHEFFRTCPECKSKKELDTWDKAFKHEPETMEEKANALLQVCRRTFYREERLKELKTLDMAHALLSTKLDRSDGKEAFEKLPGSTQETFTKMAAKAIAHSQKIYYDR